MKHCHFIADIKIFASVQKVDIHRTFLQNVNEAKFEQRDGHWKSRNGHRKVMDFFWAKYVGTLVLR